MHMKNMLMANNMSKINLTKPSTSTDACLKCDQEWLNEPKWEDEDEKAWTGFLSTMVRTLTGIVGVILSCIIMLKVFGII